jgi:hypothetical protein
MAKRATSDMTRWAELGAEARLLQLAEEAAGIFRTFPRLRSKGFMANTTDGHADPAMPLRKGTRKRTMSAAARKRISDAQKARWKKQKAAAAK